MTPVEIIVLLAISTFWTVDEYASFIAMGFWGACNIFFDLAIIHANKGDAVL